MLEDRLNIMDLDYFNNNIDSYEKLDKEMQEIKNCSY